MNRNNYIHLIALFFLLLFTEQAGAVIAVGPGDTLQIQFRVGQSNIDMAYADNERQITQFCQRVWQNLAEKEELQLNIYTGASPEGPAELNRRLGEQRGIALKELLTERLKGLSIHCAVINEGARWGQLYNLVEQSNESWREDVLTILGKRPEADEWKTDEREQRLRKLKNGLVWRELNDRYLPPLRTSGSAVIFPVRPLEPSQHDTIVIRDTIIYIPEPCPQYEPPIDLDPAWAVKTNLLLWGVIAPNIQVERSLGKTNRWSIEGEFFWPWWTWSHNAHAEQFMNLGVELRYWLGNRQKHHTLDGWHVGLGLAGGYYDFEWKRSEGWQGEYLNVYCNLGYQHRFGRRNQWAVDGGLALGWIPTKFRHYVGSSQAKDYAEQHPGKNYSLGPNEDYDNHLMWLNNGWKHILGATHANVSIAYIIGAKKKSAYTPGEPVLTHGVIDPKLVEKENKEFTKQNEQQIKANTKRAEKNAAELAKQSEKEAKLLEKDKKAADKYAEEIAQAEAKAAEKQAAETAKQAEKEAAAMAKQVEADAKAAQKVADEHAKAEAKRAAQIEKEAEAATKQAEKEAAARAKEAEKQAAEQAKQAEAATKQAEKEAAARAKEAEKQAAEQAKQAEAATKAAEKEAAARAKEVEKQAAEQAKQAEANAKAAEKAKQEAEKEAAARAKEAEKQAAEQAKQAEAQAKAAEKEAAARAKEVEKQAAEQAKAAQKIADEQAKAEAKRAAQIEKEAEAATKAAEKEAAARAKEAEKQAAEQAKQAEAQAKAAEKEAAEQAKQVEAQAKAAEKEAEANAKAAEKAKQQAEKEAAARAKEAEKQAAEQAKQAEAQAKAAEKEAAARAKEVEKQAAEQAKQAEAQAKAAEKEAAARAKEVEKQAAEQAKQAEAQAKAAEKEAAARAKQLEKEAKAAEKAAKKAM